MPKPPRAMGVGARTKICNFIVPQTYTHPQYPAARTLPSLTDIIEFWERIERSHPIIQQIALRLYGWVKGVEQQHLRRIAAIRLDFRGW